MIIIVITIRKYVNMKHLGKRLQKAREKAGLSQRELSLASGVSQGMISQIEAGNKQGGLKTLEKLAKAMGVGFNALYPADTPDTDKTKLLQDKLVYDIAKTVHPMTVKEKREVLRFAKFMRKGQS